MTVNPDFSYGNEPLVNPDFSYGNEPLPLDKSTLRSLPWNHTFGNASTQKRRNSALRYVYTKCESFNQAIQPEYKLILGRRGVGKSSLLKRIQFGNEYDCKVVIKKNEIFKFLVDSENSCLIEDYEENCIKFFWISIFRTLSREDELVKVRRFLSDANLMHGKNIRKAIQEFALHNTQSRDVLSTNIGVFINLYLESTRAKFEDARTETEDFIRHKKVVILIDNLEDYSLEKQVYRTALASVIDVAAEFTGEDNNISVKCFIPSEIFPFVRRNVISNWGKISSSIMVLHWKDSELISLLAKRLGYFLYVNDLCDHIDLSEFEDVKCASKFLQKYFSKEILNQDAVYNLGKPNDELIKEHLFPYILRHTQLTPRQVIKLCNRITELNGNNYQGSFIDSNEIIKGIARWESDLCNEIFNSFRATYPLAEDLCLNYLFNVNFSFSREQLQEKVCEQIIEGKLSHYKDLLYLLDMLSILGIVGVECRGPREGDLSIYQFYQFAEFELQNDHFTSKLTGNKLVVHPMFIRQLGLDKNDDNRLQKPICPIEAVESFQDYYSSAL